MPHIHEKIDFTVEVFIVYKNTVLLRKHDKYKIWLSVGGHIELNEDPNEAAIREVKEETGLDIKLVGESVFFPDDSDFKELIPPRSLNRHKINESHEHITLVYFARASENKIVQGAEEVSEDIRWFTQDELDNSDYSIRESVRYSAKKALAEIGAGIDF